ncbi:MAG TPA: PAS domain-containing protein, partial [Roseiflexaceae bacterium]|nr:PAS domain-containing protein [Roseiflexaceae bacterium]
MARMIKAAPAPLDFRLLFEASPGACLALAPDMTILAATERCCQLLGVERAALVNRSLADIIPDVSLALRAYETITVRFATQTLRGTSTPVADPDGQLRYMLLELAPLSTEDSAESLAPDTDAILEHAADTLQLEPSIINRKRVYGMLWQLPAAITILRGPELVFEFANPRYQQLLGTGRVLIGLPLLVAVPDIAEPILAILRHVYTTGERFIGEEYPITLDWDYNGKPYRKYL